MRTRRANQTLKICYTGLLSFTLALPVMAQSGRPDRYLDDATIAVVGIDLAQLDVAAIAAPFGDASSDDRPSVRVVQSQLNAISNAVTELRKRGVTEVYAAYSLHDFTRKMPYLILPTASEAQAERVARYLEFGSSGEDNAHELGIFRSIFTRGNTVLAGNPDLADRLDTSRIPDREEGLREALAVKGQGAIRLISVITGDQRRVITEMFPTLTDELGGLTSPQVADIDWLSLGIDLSSGRIEGIVRTNNAESAGALAEGLPPLLKGIASATLTESADVALRELLSSVEATVDRPGIKLATPSLEADQLVDVLASVMLRVGPHVRDVNITRSLKHLALGMHNFHDVHGGFPPPSSFDEDGKPLLSWRVYLLPYLDQNELYNEFHLNEPWDSEHNRQLIPRIPDVFASKHIDLNLAGKTTLQLPTGEKTPFYGKTGVAIRKITDGTSNTIMIIEAPREHAVIWTKPDDFSIDRDDLKAALFGGRSKVWTAFCDGSARALPDDLPEEMLRSGLTHAGGEIIDLSSN